MTEKLEPLAISVSEAADILGISRPMVYQLIQTKGFPAFKIGTRTLVSVDGLKLWISNQMNEGG